jgi:hypothetical protein
MHKGDGCMTFETELYRSMSEAFPGLTVRAFSTILGKSKGYWSSITSQGLSMSMNSLVNLHDALGAKLLLVEQGGRRHRQLTILQEMIKDQLLERFCIQTGFELKQAEDENCSAPLPFFYSVY